MDTAWIEAWVVDTFGAEPSPALLALAIAVGTLLSEDLSCIAAGILIAEGRLPVGWAAIGCGGGVILGDAALYGLGCAIRRGAFRLDGAFGRGLRSDSVASIRRQLVDRGSAFLFTSRFLPGIRFPVYVLAGILGWPFRRFLVVLTLAALIWTPALVGLATALGRAALDHVHGAALWITVPAFLLATLHLARSVGSRVRVPAR